MELLIKKGGKVFLVSKLKWLKISMTDVTLIGN